MDGTVGLLISRRLLKDTLAGRPSFEDVRFYLQAARRYGVELFMFDASGILRRTGRATGYVQRRNGEFRQVVRKIPTVVYDRTAPHKRAAPAWLERRGVRVFNPPLRFDKYDAHKLLRRNLSARAYLPETYLLSEASLEWFCETLAGGAEVFVKPRAGSLGRGVCRFFPMSKGRCRYQSGKRQVTFRSARSAWKRLLKEKGGRLSRYIAQCGIPLAQVAGKRFDLRIPVQKGSAGDWSVLEPRARIAGRLGYVTNVARGGTVVADVRALLARSLPGLDPDAVRRKVEGAALDVAAAVSRRHPLMADLGLDMGVDEAGRPWLIEVNVRPLRYTVKGVGDWAECYYPPIGYASYLLQNDGDDGLFASIFYRKHRKPGTFRPFSWRAAWTSM